MVPCLLPEVMLQCSSSLLWSCLLPDGLMSHSIASQLNDAQRACQGGVMYVCPAGTPACTPLDVPCMGAMLTQHVSLQLLSSQMQTQCCIAIFSGYVYPLGLACTIPW